MQKTVWYLYSSFLDLLKGLYRVLHERTSERKSLGSPPAESTEQSAAVPWWMEQELSRKLILCSAAEQRDWATSISDQLLFFFCTFKFEGIL